MIVSNTKYPFGTKVATIHTEMFKCMVSTAKEGFFKKQSTMISEVNPNGTRRRVGRLIYASSLSSGERLQMHEVVIAGLNDLDGCSLGVAMSMVFGELRLRGLVADAVNIAA